jgi:signal transduction histidine kinase
MTRMDRADLRTFLEGVARQEDRLTALCTNLLDLARLKQRGKSEEEVRVDALVHSLLDGFRLKAQSAGIALVAEIDDDAPVVVNGDRDRLGQVLQNLVDNALKFTDRGGRVVVRLKSGGPGKLAVDVEDTGCGVPAEALPRLFEPFFQVPRQAHVGQGSGLGLAIVKAVIEAHDGAITVDSVEGQGTTFRVVLAARPRPAPVADAPRGAAAE